MSASPAFSVPSPPRSPVQLAGRVVISVLAARLVLKVVSLFLGRLLAALFGPFVVTDGARPASLIVLDVLGWLATLLEVAAIVSFLVFTYVLFSGLRKRGVQTRFSPGLATFGWFIPFGNAVLPYLAMRDAWRTVVRASSAPVALWWAAWILSTVFAIVEQLMAASTGISFRPVLLDAMYYGGMVLEYAVLGSWLFMVHRLTDQFTQRISSTFEG